MTSVLALPRRPPATVRRSATADYDFASAVLAARPAWVLTTEMAGSPAGVTPSGNTTSPTRIAMPGVRCEMSTSTWVGILSDRDEDLEVE